MRTTVYPSISVVVPMYNKAPYVEKAIFSVLASGEHIHEVIVVDDGSTDDGPRLVSNIDDARVKLVRQSNQGVSAARNRGIQEASGEFIAFLDADDVWLPDYVPQIVSLIRAYPHCGMFATRYFSFDERGWVEDAPVHGVDMSGAPHVILRFFEAWARGNIFCTCSVVIPRSIFFEYDIFFPINESLGEDQDVWFRIAERFPVAYSARPLVGYRRGNFASLSKAETDGELPPFIDRLKKRYDANAVPEQHRKGIERLVGHHQLMLASRFLYRSGWTRSVCLLFNRFSIQTPKFWLKIFLAACLPKPIRLHILKKS